MINGKPFINAFELILEDFFKVLKLIGSKLISKK